jgi:four helix bundle protein
MIERRNINRGFRNLRVWQDSVALYVLSWKTFASFPYSLRKTTSQALDSAHSISRNIAEGYCRRSIKEYLNLLNIALGSCGEFHSCYVSFFQADQITLEQHEKLDVLHFKVENALIKLIKSLQQKHKHGDWQDNFAE